MTLKQTGDDKYLRFLNFASYYFKNQNRDGFDRLGKKVYVNFMAGSHGAQPSPSDMYTLLEPALRNEAPPDTPFTDFMGSRFRFMDPDRYKLYTPSVARFLIDTSYGVFTTNP